MACVETSLGLHPLAWDLPVCALHYCWHDHCTSPYLHVTLLAVAPNNIAVVKSSTPTNVPRTAMVIVSFSGNACMHQESMRACQLVWSQLQV